MIGKCMRGDVIVEWGGSATRDAVDNDESKDCDEQETSRRAIDKILMS